MERKTKKAKPVYPFINVGEIKSSMSAYNYEFPICIIVKGARDQKPERHRFEITLSQAESLKASLNHSIGEAKKFFIDLGMREEKVKEVEEKAVKKIKDILKREK